MRWPLVLTLLILTAGCASPEQKAMGALEDGLGASDYVRYKEVNTYPGGVVCGRIQVTNKWGESTRAKRFVYQSDAISTNPSQDDWAIFCNEDPAAALYEKQGINTTDEAMTARLKQIRSDLHALEKTLKNTASENITPPNDPWGAPYRIEAPWHGGVAGETKVYTLGADGTRGGKDDNADVGNWHLKYLDHIL